MLEADIGEGKIRIPLWLFWLSPVGEKGKRRVDGFPEFPLLLSGLANGHETSQDKGGASWTTPV